MAVTKREKWLRDGNKWDDIVPDRELHCNVMYMVVDVETHDWKDSGPRNGVIVEMAWMVFDRDMKCIESKQLFSSGILGNALGNHGATPT